MMNILLLAVFMTYLTPSLSNPVPALDSGSVQARSGLHACGVFVQRWCADCETSFDVTVFNRSDPTAQWAFPDIITVESTKLAPPDTLPPATIGSHQLIITDVATPVNVDDPGKLSFVWGSETWNNWSGTQCSNIPVGHSQYAYATNTSCSFECDY